MNRSNAFSGSPAPWSSHSSLRANSFTAMRLVLAVLVLFTHSYPILRGPASFEPLYTVSAGEIHCGIIAVNCFLALSGFVIAQSVTSSSSYVRFLKRRALRIYPAFIVLMAVQAYVVAPLITGTSPLQYSVRQHCIIVAETANLMDYGQGTSRLPSVFVNNPLPEIMNGSLWSVRYEFICYIMVVGLTVAGALRRKSVLLVLFALSAVLHFLGVTLDAPGYVQLLIGQPSIWLRVLTYFLSGMVFWRLREYIPYSEALALACMGICAIAIAFPPLLRLALPTCGTYALFVIGYQPSLYKWVGGLKADYSYGTYLYGFVVQQLLVWLIGASVELASFFLLSVACSVAMGALSWYLVERRFVEAKAPRAKAPLATTALLEQLQPVEQ